MRGRMRDAGAFDVAVCGGGPAGLCAATAAARLGAKTALIERCAFLGGMATAGMVTPISEYNKAGQRVIGGIPWEFALRLADLGGAELGYHNGNVPFDQEIYKLAAQRMLLEAGVRLFLDSLVDGAQVDGGRVTRVRAAAKTGPFSLSAKVFLDCTGDADLAVYADAPMQPAGGELQPMTLWFRLGGVDTEALSGLRLDGENVRGHNEEARAALLASGEAGSFGGPWFFLGPAPGIVNVNATRAAGYATKREDALQAALTLREDVFRLTRILKERVAPFRRCYVLDTAPLTGVRESRRLKGLHVVTAEELLIGADFPDSVARGAHPLDLHAARGEGQRLTGLEQACHIPFRCMAADGYPNLLVAGRCVSATHEAQSSLRVQATCMAEGEAAGTAAALCVKSGVSVHDLDTDALRGTLSARGAIL